MRPTKFKTQRNRHIFFVDAKRKALQGHSENVATGHRQHPDGVNKNLGTGQALMGA